MKNELITPIFKVTSSVPYNDNYKFYRLECPQWVNVIPITKNQKVVMVKQYRYGVDQETLEFPAGLVDNNDASFMDAAIRELTEETGYGSDQWTEIGWVHPNTAIQNNRCYCFLATDVEKIYDTKNDLHENIEVVLIDLEKIPNLIFEKKITHSLVMNAFLFYCLQQNKII